MHFPVQGKKSPRADSILFKLGLSDHSFNTVKLFIPCPAVNAFFADNRSRSKERKSPYSTHRWRQALFSLFFTFFKGLELLDSIGLSRGFDVERRKIEQALKEAAGSKGRAAEVLQLGYKVLLAKMREHGLDA